MEPATMSDLKDFMKELRESMKESIREAVAAGFGNSRPALEHTTTTSAPQLLAMRTSDTKVLAPACSSPDQGTSALDLAPTTTINILPELDSDTRGVAALTPTTCSTDGLSHNAHGDDLIIHDDLTHLASNSSGVSSLGATSATAPTGPEVIFVVGTQVSAE